MDILVSGSMAYDRIMNFNGRFSDHILPDQLDNISISLLVDSLTEHIGGTAGNIAYSLSLLGEKPRILAAMGRDYHQYFEWLDRCGISTDDIRIVEDELTAGAYITTDLNSNQFTGFNPGAMKHQAGFSYDGVNASDTMAIVGPGNLADMMEFTARNNELGIFSIFDPGQSLPIWEPEALSRCIGQSDMLICNEYELGMISNSTGLSQGELAGMVEHLVVTLGAEGAEFHSRGASERVPVVPADAVDPTGAGDAFRGGLIKGLAHGLGIKRAVEMGAVCGYYVVQVNGTQTYRYTQAEYDAKLRECFGE
ncbi:MAG: carbohydrate kinase family protein [Chloroflexi bacterium]|nr:carbohydrate kinase family protein [Chloroflexota bacterium]MYE40699.1 carbohydrate kinase family protein [Chloroflexota bacterium]